MKKNRSEKNSNIIILVCIAIVIAVYLLSRFKSNVVAVSSPELDLTISIPSNYKATQKFGTITVETPHGEITINRYGSFFNNLEDEIKDLSKKNNIQIDIIEKIKNHNYEIYKVKFNHHNPQPTDISYLILTDYRVYSFQANSETLYTDLDAIAKSFRYNP